MSKHTPAPWGINADGIHAGDLNGFQPFSGCGCCGSPWMDGKTKDEQLANAMLIVASPELLDALIEAIKVIEKIKPPEYGNGTIVRGKAAILKATGEPV